MTIVGAVLFAVLEALFIFLLARLVFDYVFLFARSWRPSGPLVVLLELIYSVTDPPLKGAAPCHTALAVG